MTDNELIEKLHDDTLRDAAFEYVVKTYSQRLYFHIRRIVVDHNDAHDVLQDTFLRAYSAIDSFRANASIAAWLYKIATNTALSFLNRKKRYAAFATSNYEDKLADSLQNDDYFDGDELQRRLQQAILKLPTKQRLVFNMRYYDDMQYEQMSEILGTSVGALKASYHHAVKKIENFLNDD